MRIRIWMGFSLHLMLQRDARFRIFITAFLSSTAVENLFPTNLAEFMTAASCLSSSFPDRASSMLRILSHRYRNVLPVID